MKPHFLVVEDSVPDTELICAWLERHFRCDITCVASNREALDAFCPGRFAAAFVNLCLQHNRRGGLEVIRRFRDWESDLPIFVVSGYEEERLRMAAIVAGASGFFSKDMAGSEGECVRNMLRFRLAAAEKGRVSVNKSWRTTLWGVVAALGSAMFAAPTALLVAKSSMPEMAEIVNALPPKLLAYTLLGGVLLGPFGLTMLGKSGRDQKEAEKFWTEHKKNCPGHGGPESETETKT